MSMHYIYIRCGFCEKAESIYTGNIELEQFDDDDWEGETIEVTMCKDCKAQAKETE